MEFVPLLVLFYPGLFISQNRTLCPERVCLLWTESIVQLEKGATISGFPLKGI